MGLESSPTYISDLNSAWPLGTDVKSAGDDHFRNIKATLLTTFPSITGAVTATHTELNLLDGVTATTAELNELAGAAGGAGMVHDIAALTDANADRILFWDDSAGAVAQLAIGGNVLSISGTTLSTSASGLLTDIKTVDGASSGLDADLLDGQEGSYYTNASNLASGSVPDARLGNAALKNAANTFTAAQLVAVANPAMDLTDSTVSVTYQIDTSNTRVLFGTTTNHGLLFLTNLQSRFEISSGGNFDFKGGTVTRNNASASEVGYAGSPLRSITSSDNTAATDAGKTVRMTGGSGQTFTLDGDPPTDSRVTLINSSGNNWTISASGTLTHPSIGTGSRTLATGATAIFHHLGSGSWYYLAGGGTIT